MSILAVSALYVAAIIGAGFASGKELTTFFVVYGKAGALGIGVSLIFLTLGTGLTLSYCEKNQAESYKALGGIFGPRGAVFFELIYSFFLLIGAAAMFAGSAALVESGVWSLIFRMSTAFLVFWVLKSGVESTLTKGRFLTPVLVLSLLTFALLRLGEQPITFTKLRQEGAFSAGLLYGSYNLGFAMAVLASIHHTLQTKKERWLVALISNAILGVCLLVLYLALGSLSHLQLQEPLPILNLLTNRGLAASYIYRVILWGAMYSTALANVLALASWFKATTKVKWNQSLLFITIIAFFSSYLGFSSLIEVAYPFLGLVGLWIFAHLLRYQFRKAQI